MKKVMKKLLSLGLVAAMAVGTMVGCGSKGGSSDDTKSASDNVKIGVLVADVSGVCLSVSS